MSDRRAGRLAACLARLLALCAALQLARWGLESLLFLAVPRTPLSDELVRAGVLFALLAALLAASRQARLSLSLLPRRLGPGYRASLAGAACLFLATPLAAGQAAEPAAWASLACTAIATPLFEETLFRGYAWARIQEAAGTGAAADGRAGRPPVLATSALFGLWHFGYADAVAWQLAAAGEPAGAVAVLGALAAKAAVGALVGLVLGILRQRCRCALAPALFHAAWNILA